jgi:Rrf2 family iron-sulfur cluster assembly transcriptional regulator
MKLSAKSRYASRILLDLVLHNEGAPHRVNDISERTGITVPFIEQIIKPLKHAGMVASKRGAAGGHQLNRPADKITLGDIVRIVEGSVDLAACLSAPESCTRVDVCLTRAAWQRATDAMLRELDAITLAELAKGAPNCCQLADDYFERERPLPV